MTTDEHGYETHPAFGMAQVNRVQATPAKALFDSELQHHTFVVLRISGAVRKRELKRDWIYDTGPQYIEVAMSMAQWGALVSSFGTAGVPVTITAIKGEEIPKLDYEPRMAQSLKEINEAAEQMVWDIEEAVEKVRDAFEAKAGRKEMAELLHDLTSIVGNTRPNADFTARQFSKHVEDTITKARADIESMVHSASQRGLEAGAMPLIELPGTTDEWCQDHILT
jgi:hypothetical protein